MGVTLQIFMSVSDTGIGKGSGTSMDMESGMKSGKGTGIVSALPEVASMTSGGSMASETSDLWAEHHHGRRCR